MSPRTTSTALAMIFALSALPLMAQTTTEVPPVAPADSASDAADAAATAADQAAEAAEGAAEATGDAAEAAADAAAAAASDAAAAADNAAEAATEAATETDTEATAETAPAAEEATTDTPADAAAGAEPSEPPVGAYYPRSTHGDWTLRCIKTADAADPCELYQLMKDGQGNSVAEITLIPLEGESQAVAGATIVTPLETDLTQGIRLQVDSGQPKAYPFNFCAPVGCVSRVGLTEAELGSLKRGNAATVSLLPYGAGADQIVSLNMSLTGFTAGYTELEAAVAEMREAVAAAQAAAPADTPAATPATDAPAEPAAEESAPAQ